MKIRQGFVSNSSSASYIVTLHKTFDNRESLMIDLYDTCWCAFNESEEEYFNAKEYLAYRYPEPVRTTITPSPMSESLAYLHVSHPDRVRHMTADDDSKYLETNEDKIAAVEYTLEQERIDIKEVGNGRYSLTNDVSMHNSFNDMNDLLKNIYLEYLVYQGGATFIHQSDN